MYGVLHKVSILASSICTGEINVCQLHETGYAVPYTKASWLVDSSGFMISMSSFFAVQYSHWNHVLPLVQDTSMVSSECAHRCWSLTCMRFTEHIKAIGFRCLSFAIHRHSGLKKELVEVKAEITGCTMSCCRGAHGYNCNSTVHSCLQ